MFHRIAGRGLRSISQCRHANRSSHREFWSKQEIPVQTRRFGGPCEGFVAKRNSPWVAKELEGWRKLAERAMQSRMYDWHNFRPGSYRYTEEAVRSDVKKVCVFFIAIAIHCYKELRSDENVHTRSAEFSCLYMCHVVLVTLKYSNSRVIISPQ